MQKKGFTLVELMVVIALIAGISVIAIVSLTGIADKRKEEQWDNTKALIETAAKNYYKANEYMFEGLSTGTAYITVGKLVNEGYLNKVTNPMTKKTVGYCNKVLINITDSKVTYKYEDVESTNTDKTSCDFIAQNDELEVRSSKNISATIVYKKEDGTVTQQNGNWFNIASLGENGKLNVCIKTKIVTVKQEIGAIGSEKQLESSSTNEYCLKSEDYYGNGNHQQIKAYIEDGNGEYWMKIISLPVDTLKPNCTVSFMGTSGINGWYTSNVSVSANSSSTPASGFSYKNVSNDINGTFSATGSQSTNTRGATWYGKVASNAGNERNICQGSIKVDKTNPVCEISFDGDTGENGWYTSDVTVTATSTSSPMSGFALKQVSTTSNGTYQNSSIQTTETLGSTWYGKVKTNAGLSSTCNAVVKVDKTPPIITAVTLTSTESNYNSNIVYGNFKITDPVSGIDEVSSNYPNKDSGNQSWNRNGDKIWDFTGNSTRGYRIKLANSLNGSRHTLTMSATDMAGNSNSGSSPEYIIATKSSPTTTPATCNAGTTYSKCTKEGMRTKTETSSDCKTTSSTQKCGVESIELDLNTNADSHSTHPGMNGRGPAISNPNNPDGHIFDRPDGDGATTHVFTKSPTRGFLTSYKGNYSYFAAACKYSMDYPRRFKVKITWAKSGGTNTSSDWLYMSIRAGNITGTKTFFDGTGKRNLTVNLNDYNRTVRYGCENNDSISTSCGSSSGSYANVTIHKIKATAAKKTSNDVILYTKYFADCNYDPY